MTDAVDPRSWRNRLAPYQQPSLGRSIAEIAVSAAPLALIWIGAWFATAAGLWWLALLLAVPAAGFLVRLFMVQHDCSHHAFFKEPAANDWIGRTISILTLTPYDYWRQTHAVHHATSGDLDRRGLGDMVTLTVEEYRAASFWRRAGYRIYRHPLVLFGIGPALVFFLQHRLPVGLMRGGWRPWCSVMATTAGVAAFALAVSWLVGWQALLLVHVPTMALAASIGVWLFYVQHQFDGTYWARRGTWAAAEAALHGSSHYDLPHPLRWLTANIGIHHVHHINSRIPFYRLHTVLNDHPELRSISRLGLLESLNCASLTLWDEADRRLISFREFKQR
jgi:acyl-lipid omega-6 desaturase (Delta-12 desaturase)